MTPTVMPSPGQTEAGFTLIEVMVAFTILTLSVGVVSVIFSNGLRVAGNADGYTRAIAVAEAKIAEFTLPENLKPGQTQGLVGDIQWQTTVLPGFFDPAAVAAANGTPAPNYYQISVLVAWGGREAGQTLNLATIRLPPRGQAQMSDVLEPGEDEATEGEGVDGEGEDDSGNDSEE